MAEQILSREEILGGLPARRAATVLHAIRARTASSAARSRRPLGGYVGERGAAQRESEFLAALASGRDPRAKPSAQGLERYASEWAALVPTQAALRAAIVQRLGAEERLPRERVPRLRAALGLDEPETQAAFARATGHSLETIYAPGSAWASVSPGAAPGSPSGWSGCHRSGSPSRSRSPSASEPASSPFPLRWPGSGRSAR